MMWEHTFNGIMWSLLCRLLPSDGRTTRRRGLGWQAADKSAVSDSYFSGRWWKLHHYWQEQSLFIFSLCWTHCCFNHKFSSAWLLMQPWTAQLVPALHNILAKVTLFVTAIRGHLFKSSSHLSAVGGRRTVTLFRLRLTRQVVFPHCLFPKTLQQKKKEDTCRHRFSERNNWRLRP